MNVDYRSDLQDSYLVLIPEKKENTDTYPLRMITENQIQGLLPCECKWLDHEILYYYDITSKLSLSEKWKDKKITGEEILLVVNQILQVLQKLEEFLLDGNSLCLNPQYIYVNKTMEKVDFCYVPGEWWDIEVQFRQLMEFILPNMEHQDQESMLIGYGIYHYALRERFSIEGLHKHIGIYIREKSAEPKEEISQSEEIEPDIIAEKEKQEIWDSFWSDDEAEEDKKRNRVWIWVSVVIGLGYGGLGWIMWTRFFTYIWIWVFVGMMFIGGIIFTKRKKKKKRLPEKGEENTSEEIFTEMLKVPRQIYVLETKENTADRITLENKNIQFVGRMEGAVSIRLVSRAVSRIHARFRLNDGRCFLCDWNSKNGTYINHIRLEKDEERELYGGEEIQFADVYYYLRKYDVEK